MNVKNVAIATVAVVGVMLRVPSLASPARANQQNAVTPPETRTVMPTNTGYVTTDDGVRLFYERVGNGPKMLLIPNGPPLSAQSRPF